MRTPKCSTETVYSSTKRLITLEESHFEVSKRPNIGFVDSRHLWGEGLMTIGENHFSAATLTNRASGF